MEAREVAIKLIKPYVRRGDSLDNLISGQLGFGSMEYSAGIGGYVNGKPIKRDELAITRVNGKECVHIFKVKKLYDEIKSGQQSLI